MKNQHTKYIMGIGQLSRKDNSILFKNDKCNNYIPIQNVKEIFCLNEVSFNSKFLELLSHNHITTHFFNYYNNYVGSFYPKEHYISGKLLVKQSLCYLEKRETIAKSIVQGIANNIHQVLYHYIKQGNKDVKPYLDWIKQEVPSLLIKPKNINQIMFIEGQIWEGFYNQFKYFLREDFIINKRLRRPPDNPINALISFGNMWLYTKTITQIYHTHLNQTISFLHEPSEQRFSLSLDLSEVFKPVIIFKTIFDLVNNKRLQVTKHFDKSLNYCLLNKEGKKIFITALEERITSTFKHNKLKRNVTYLSCIKYDAYKLIKFIMENKEFTPFNLKELK